MKRIARISLFALVAIGLYVGTWAGFFPAQFYESFPGFGFHWIAIDGPYNEHLIRDVGVLNLALAAVSAMAWRDPTLTRAAAIAWLVYSVPHFGYHMVHLHHLPLFDVAGQVVSLSSTIVLGGILLLRRD